VADYAFAEVVEGLNAGETVSLEQQLDHQVPKATAEKSAEAKKPASTATAGKDEKKPEKKELPATAVKPASTSTAVQSPASSTAGS